MNENEAIEVQAQPVELAEATAAPAMTPDALARRYNDLAELMRRNVLVDGSDYGVIPGTGDKPTLYKAGAEKLAAFFGLSIEMELVDKVEDWDGGFFYYRYRATATDRYGRTASGEGSANSREAKYRWRNIKEREYDPEVHGPGRKIQKSGRYGSYVVYQVENREPFDLVNTLQKMAQKRAYVQAVLLAVGASAFFTQDVEDLAAAGVVGEEPAVEQAQPAQRQRRVQPTQAAQSMPSPNDKIKPLTIHAIADALELAGINDKEIGKTLVRLIVGREYGRTTDLTAAEGQRVVEYLARLVAAMDQAEVPREVRQAYIAAVVESGELPPTDTETIAQDYQAFAGLDG